MENTQQVSKFNNVEVLLPEEMDGREPIRLPSVSTTTPMDLPVEIFTKALDRREENRKALLRWIESNLKQGIDFGKIHIVGKDKCQFAQEGRAYECPNPRHWSKPSLWKPGAEKISGMLGLIPRFPNLDEYEKAVLAGGDINVIIIKCELHTPAGFIAAEGSGARRVAQDSGDINKTLKMTEKSAHIDATLRVAGLSEIFSQDIEDMVAGNSKVDIQPDTNSQPRQTVRDEPPQQQYQQDPTPQMESQRLSQKQFRYIISLASNRGIDRNALNQKCLQAYGVGLEYLSKADASSIIKQLLEQ